MPKPRSAPLRDLVAVLVVAVACPVALFGGSMAGCVGQGFTSECAMSAIVIAPVLLLAAGAVAGLLAHGRKGMLVTYLGVVIGMTTVLVLTYAAGRPVPLDLFAGAIATIWFLAPVWIGYGVSRVVAALLRGAPER